MGAGEIARSQTHRRKAFSIAQQADNTRPQSIGIGDALRRTSGDGILGRLQKIEGMRTNQHRTPASGCLDQVLPTQRQKTATHESQVGEAEIGGHFTHAVAQPNLGVAVRQRLAAAHRMPALLP